MVHIWTKDFLDMTAQPKSPHGQHLYVIQCATGHIKIGRSSDPRGRLRTLEDCSPFEMFLVHVCQDRGHEERAILAELRPYWYRGEWHIGTTACRQAVSDLLDASLMWPTRTGSRGFRVEAAPGFTMSASQRRLAKRGERELDEALGTSPDRYR